MSEWLGLISFSPVISATREGMLRPATTSTPPFHQPAMSLDTDVKYEIPENYEIPVISKNYSE